MTDVDIFSDPEALAALDGDTLRALRMMKWREPGDQDQFFARQTARELDIDYVTALRLEKEQFERTDYAQYEQYMNPDRSCVRSPEETVPGMTDAAAHLLSEIKDGKVIALFFDYDVDGTTSGYVVDRAMREAGAADAQIIHGFATVDTGFGLTSAFVHTARDAGATTLITVDCGSTQTKEVALAQSFGMKVIIVDHHKIDPENPAEFHLNPQFISELAAADLAVELTHAEKFLKDAQKLKQNAMAKPHDEKLQAQLEEKIAASRDLMAHLDLLSGHTDSPSTRLAVAIERLKGVEADTRSSDHNTGAQLSWKFGAALLEASEGETPDHWYGTPMYMAGQGALADMADMTNIENRAFCRIPLAEAVSAHDPAVDARMPQALARIEASERALFAIVHGADDGDRAFEALRADNTHYAAYLEARARTTARNEEAVERIVPPALRALSAEFEEDLADPGSCMRTRAALNIPKRSSVLSTSRVLDLYKTDADGASDVVSEVFAAYETITQVRGEMAEVAREDIKRRARNMRRSTAAREPYWATAVIDDYEDHAGQAGVLAQGFVKEFQKPSAVFVARGVDAEGEPVYKLSMRNGIVKRVKIGVLEKNPTMVAMCRIAEKDENGQISMELNLGGHDDVLSGAVRKENIPAVIKTLEAFADAQAQKDPRYGWYVRPRNAVWVSKRLVDPADLQRIEREASLINPSTNGNYPTRVSVAARFVFYGEANERGLHPAVMVLPDGQMRQADVTTEAHATLKSGTFFEVAISPGPRTYWVRDIRPIDRPRRPAAAPVAAAA